MSESNKKILVVDDDPATVEVLSRALQEEGYKTGTSSSTKEALERLRAAPFDLVITDLVMPGMDGIGLLEEVKRIEPLLPVVVCTGYGTIPTAIEAIRKGAVDYLAKPIKLEQLFLVIERALKTSLLAQENRRLKEELSRRDRLDEIVGRSAAIEKVYERIHAVSPTGATVLIRGESGTGKELVAHAIHRLSARKDGPLVTVNCAAFTDTLIESELFGHEKGAFTGAYKQTKGRVELADGGTLFLDEIGDLSAVAQTKLLRLLQERTFERVGGTEALPVDVRVIGATHRNLEELIKTGAFREDLYYRINVFQILLPSLRERVEDIGLLFRHFLAEFCARYGKEELTVQRAALAALERYDWPGNIREMRNLVESLVITAQGDKIRLSDLPDKITGEMETRPGDGLLDGAHRLNEIQREAIHRTLARTNGNKVEAAAILGIGLKTLYRRLNEEEPDATDPED